MKYLHALNLINGVGSQKMRALLNHFETAEAAWQASSAELIESGIPEKLAGTITTERKNINPDQAWEILEKEKIRLVSEADEHYPALLKEIHNPPHLLYIKGTLETVPQPAIAIVGSRRFTSYGQQAAYALSKDLAAAGITIVSGMAFGIDAIAHRGAMDAGTPTVAVLGNSLDDASIAPRTHFELSKEIAGNGLLASEYPPVTPANEGTFPARNRLMAGMTRATLVIEAAEKSGSLITANLAIEFNRDVFAVPGSIFSETSVGTHRLIKKGAALVSSAGDIIEALALSPNVVHTERRPIADLPPEEQAILRALENETLHIDKIIEQTRLDSPTASATLAMLEMNGMIKNIGGQNYIRL